MSTAPTTIGPYTITHEIGRGGMGVVYLAMDSRLDRQVAIKALPEHLAADPDRLGRFEREAKTLASLSHANVAGIYGVEEQEGRKYLVLEYVEGETLAERLDRGAMPFDEALEVCTQIAAGVEAAHEAGVIHRDLKPSNIIITPEGKVKVLDFGLAKVAEGSSSGSHQSETVTSPVHQRHSPTIPGVILGTAAYMSPEQARGRQIDERTDIWSFGVVLYECLTGANPFLGETVSDSIGAILHKEITLDGLSPDTPPMVRHILRRCLERDKTKRLQSAGDIRIEFEDVSPNPTSALSARTHGAAWIWPAVTLVLAAALGASLLLPTTTRTEDLGQLDPAPVVTELTKLTDLSGMQTDPSISPDGRMILFVAREGQNRDIFLQRVGGENAINLTADSAADDYDPAFSPNGERIAFRSGREGGGLFIMGATGESPRRVSDEGFDPAWSPDGKQIVYTTEDVEGPYSRNSTATLWALDLASRDQRRLTDQDAVGPRFSPNGKFIAFWAAIAGVRDVFIVPADGGDARAVTQDSATDWSPFFSPDGKTLYFISDRSGTPDIWSIPIDPESGRVAGKMRPITAGVTRVDHATMAADGEHIVFAASHLMSTIERYPFDAENGRIAGEGERVYASTSVFHQFDVTRNGKRLAFRTDAPREDLVVMNLDGSGRRRLTDDIHRDRGPRWTPDGEWLLFYSNRGGLYDAWRVRPDGTGLHRLTATERLDVTSTSLSPNQRIMAISIATETGAALILHHLDRAVGEIDQPIAVPEPECRSFGPAHFSPDGTRIVGLTPEDFVAVYDLQSKVVTRVRGPDGDMLYGNQYSAPDWIDDHALVLWDEARSAAFVYDLQTETPRVIPGLDDSCDIRVVEDGRALVVNRLRAESDVWMLRLETLDGQTSSDGETQD